MQVQEQVALKNWTWWKIGGHADFFCQPSNVQDVQEALRFAHDRQLPITVLGGGTNVLVSDQGVAGLVINMRRLTEVTEIEDGDRLRITALAGTNKSELTKIFLKRKMEPALFLCGLPGDIGGGVVMNAGVSEASVPREFGEMVDWIEFFSLEDFALKRQTHDQITWQYRSTSGWQPGVLVRVGLSWPLKEDPDIARKVKAATKNRLQTQPLELPSCGSTFKNPIGAKAGALIDASGLKGYQVGAAQVSTKHANFIVNLGGATAEDVRSVMRHVQATVKAKFAIELEPEVKLVGRW